MGNIPTVCTGAYPEVLHSPAPSTSEQFEARVTLRDQPYPDIQYLSRQHLHHPPTPEIVLGSMSPVKAVNAAALRHWLQYEEKQPVAAVPTFSAAPQSDYYGAEVLSDGQIMHRSLAKNVSRVMKNSQTGRTYVLGGHKFILHFQAPADPNATWTREIPYPSDATMREAMMALQPRDLPIEGETGFPMHATKNAPPLLPMKDRLSVRWVRDLSDFAQPHTYPAQARDNDTVSPDDTLLQSIAEQTTNTNYVAVYDPRTGEFVPTPPSTTSSSPPPLVGSPAAPFSSEDAVLDSDIYERAVGKLRLRDFDGNLYAGPTLQYEDSEGTSQDFSSQDLSTSDFSSVDVDICQMCFEPRHVSLMDCPMWGPSAGQEAHAPIEGSPAMAPPSGTFYFMDDIILDDGLIPRTLAVPANPIELQNMLENALTPTLNMLLSLPADDAVRYTMLVETAREVRNAYIDFVQQLGAKVAERERQNVEEMTREIEGALINFPSHGDHIPNTATTATRTNDVEVVLNHSHVARIETPVFDYRRGEPVSRDLWSSSSPGTVSSSSGEDAAYPPYPAYPPGIRANSSYVITEWSVGSGDSLVDPQYVIDTAVSRVIAQAPERATLPSNATVSSTNSDSLGSVAGIALPLFRLQTRPAPPSPAELQRQGALLWQTDGTEHQLDHQRFEDEMGAHPLRHALKVLHEQLHDFIDFTAMAADNIRSLQLLSDVSLGLWGLPSSPPTSPDPSQSPTSLKFSLPTTSESAAALSDAGVESNEEGAVDDADGSACGEKRKNLHGEAEGGFQKGSCKKRRKFQGDLLRRTVIKNEAIKATNLDAYSLQMFAGVQLAMLEGVRRIEGMAWQRYGVPEVCAYYPDIERTCAKDRSTVAYKHHLPNTYVRHPLLFDLEAAKFHALWSVLQHNKRYTLANLLSEVLTIRLRDEYALSHLLNAGHLEHHYPDAYSRYWELLPGADEYPDAHLDCMDTDSDKDDSDYSDDENFQLPSCFELGYPNYPDSEAAQSPSAMDLHTPVSTPEPMEGAPGVYATDDSADGALSFRDVEVDASQFTGNFSVF
ncbi:hypothetical protein C8R44DRAFT_872199 [Mycena epipterygia]|nr:hypothetical protein C8R44DRAFT_872199 [Mycena epipterygia]